MEVEDVDAYGAYGGRRAAEHKSLLHASSPSLPVCSVQAILTHSR